MEIFLVTILLIVLFFLTALVFYLEDGVADRMLKDNNYKCGLCNKKLNNDWIIPETRDGVYHEDCYVSESLKQHPPGSFNHFGL